MADVEIEPIFDREVKIVNPAIDIIEGKAAIGVWLPCRVVSIKRDGESEERTDFYPFYITEDRKHRPLHDLPPGYALGSKPVQTEPRWRVEDIKRFIDGAEAPGPADVFYSVLNAWCEFLEFSSHQEYIFRTLWDISTYFAHIFRTFPYDYIGGVKGTGKTKALMLHAAICFNAILSGNMTTAAIYRLIQNARATLLIDETERLAGRDVDKERALDFRNILLFGYKKGSRVYRVEKSGTGKSERLITKPYEVYGPKALANIKGIGDILADRCKITIMPRAKGEQGKREIDLDNPRWTELRDRLYRFYLAYWREIKAIYDGFSEHDELVNVGTDRERELWTPILALARFFDGHLVNVQSELCEDSVCDKYTHTRLLKTIYTNTPSSLTECVIGLAQENAKIKHTEEMAETGEFILLQVLLAHITESNYYRVKVLRDKMATYFDETQDWLTTRWVGNALRRLGFMEKRRVGPGYEYRLDPKTVKDIAGRLGVEANAELAMIELMGRLGELYKEVGGVDLTPEEFLTKAKTKLPNERESRLNEAIDWMSEPFKISKEVGLNEP